MRLMQDFFVFLASCRRCEWQCTANSCSWQQLPMSKELDLEKSWLLGYCSNSSPKTEESNGTYCFIFLFFLRFVLLVVFIDDQIGRSSQVARYWRLLFFLSSHKVAFVESPISRSMRDYYDCGLLRRLPHDCSNEDQFLRFWCCCCCCCFSSSRLSGPKFLDLANSLQCLRTSCSVLQCSGVCVAIQVVTSGDLAESGNFFFFFRRDFCLFFFLLCPVFVYILAAFYLAGFVQQTQERTGTVRENELGKKLDITVYDIQWLYGSHSSLPMELGLGVLPSRLKTRNAAPPPVLKRRRVGVARAMFWRKQKRLEPLEKAISFSMEQMLSYSSTTSISVSVSSSIHEISAKDWDACALGATGADSSNPFISHAFFSSLEDSNSSVVEKGWLPQHLVAKDETGKVRGVVPLYLKSHSSGEYVFDHSWANAFYSYGQNYYPKLQCCVPFTPATGPRILVPQGPERELIFGGLCKAMKAVTHEFEASSLHITFSTEDEWKEVSKYGFLQRMGLQYHWHNANYKSFDDFLASLKQTKRKRIRQERKKVLEQNLKLKRLRGDDIKPHHWDSFYTFYQNTTDNKWGQAYLTREFFHLLGSRLGDKVLLIVAEDGGELVAGALNLIGGDTLYGRNWGCLPNVFYPMLHFEACYYQAIEAAIEWGLKRVEAGAQGEHKMQRGYVPCATYSLHYIPHPEFRLAISNFLRRETSQVKLAIELLDESSPYKSMDLNLNLDRPI